MERTLKALRLLKYVSSVKLIGSFAKGKQHPKDIDVLIKLRINDATLWKNKRQIKTDVRAILRKYPPPMLLDIFLLTSDKKRWRLRPWEDIATKKLSYDWE